MATLHRHLESLNDVADVLLDQWREEAKTNSIAHLEKDLYCYFVQVRIFRTSMFICISDYHL